MKEFNVEDFFTCIGRVHLADNKSHFHERLRLRVMVQMN